MNEKTISIKQCRELREAIKVYTSACFLTEQEYLQIMVVLMKAGERMENESAES